MWEAQLAQFVPELVDGLVAERVGAARGRGRVQSAVWRADPGEGEEDKSTQGQQHVSLHWKHDDSIDDRYRF